MKNQSERERERDSRRSKGAQETFLEGRRAYLQRLVDDSLIGWRRIPEFPGAVLDVKHRGLWHGSMKGSQVPSCYGGRA
jgi:hypothetical protein